MKKELITKCLLKELITKCLLFVSAIASITLLHKNNRILTIVLIIIFLLGIRAKFKKHDILFFMGAAVVCSFGEILCVKSQCWQYTNPSIWEIPLWLPIAWGTVSVGIKRIAVRLAI